MRIGGVPYGVGAPLLAGLDSDPGVEFVQAPPTELIRALQADQLDCALVSSVEAVQHPGYSVVPGLGIACKREIRSVRAFRRRGVPIRSVGLDQSSATSSALLRLLLARVHAAEVAADVRFQTIAPTLSPASLPHDLVLLIGDCGLQAAAGDREVWDLGQKWQQWTKLPFVFAVWLLRAGADAAAIVKTLAAARARGRQLGAVDGTHGAAHYDLDDEDVRGLRHFWAECRALGLASASDPRFVPHSIPASR
ncbi:MAG TPA: MqnA/MqnD/SBP family protein [Planctomycetota bacterium]|nr:MqnA/MqnD/SBP family protein [Planctomycetota bacterium]